LVTFRNFAPREQPQTFAKVLASWKQIRFRQLQHKFQKLQHKNTWNKKKSIIKLIRLHLSKMNEFKQEIKDILAGNIIAKKASMSDSAML
jgi:hypothetical protein